MTARRQSATVRYACQACGYASPRWLGRCPGCQGWNTLVEERTQPARSGTTGEPGRVAWLTEVDVGDAERLPTGLVELDRVLGGGLVPGSFVLIGGDPGIGKSTLLLQAAAGLSVASGPVLYVTAEESPAQVKLRAARLGLPGERVAVMAETRLEAVDRAVREVKPRAAVIDSIQTVWSEGLGSAPGSVGQVRECAAQLLRLAKTEGCALLVVCHVTKDGALAGPKTLEHLADTVLAFEGDRHHLYRLLRSGKNRYGSTNELGVFEMTGTGLKAVGDLSGLFLPGSGKPAPGRAVAACLEGSRPLLVEVQALVASAAFGMPQRRAAGADQTRLTILLAVLEQRLGCHLSGSDVFLNVAGGLLIEEPAADLACALAIVSAFRNVSASPLALVGEVGLAGELRPVVHLERRLEEAVRLGFSRALVPAENLSGLSESLNAAIAVEGAATLAEAAEAVLGERGGGRG